MSKKDNALNKRDRVFWSYVCQFLDDGRIYQSDTYYQSREHALEAYEKNITGAKFLGFYRKDGKLYTK